MSQEHPYLQDSDAPGKALILEHGLCLFARQGLSATSIRDIAKATGLSNPALYKHFGTKDELALVLFERLYRVQVKQLSWATGQTAHFSGKFQAFLEGWLGALDRHPEATIFIIDNLKTLWSQMPEEMQSKTILSVLREIIQLGRAEGSVSSGIDIQMQLALVVGMLENLARQVFFGTFAGPVLPQAGEVEHLLRQALR